MKIDYETSLNGAYMHIVLDRKYKEDYQIRMLENNQIKSLLKIEGGDVEGKSKYTFDISGLVSMQKKFEKNGMKIEELKGFLTELLEQMKVIQKFMLDEGNLILRPECIFYKDGKWIFGYLPDNPDQMNSAFHQMTEYFVKTVDYKDTEAIFLAYELHRASFQDNFHLEQVLIAHEEQGKERERELEELREKQKLHDNIFNLEDDDNSNTNTIKESTFAYNPVPSVAAIREEVSGWQPWKKRKDSQKGRWGKWNDLILESNN